MFKTLLAAVTRIFKPGTKFDNVLILKGDQGVGKSTFIRLLASDKWFTDSLTQFDGKEAFELLAGNWLVELGELKGLYRKEAEQAKQFFSKTSDKYRAAYARRPKDHPRQCVFIGTTNNETFLIDRTGNRRFWPVGLGVTRPTKSVFKDLPIERDQIWAEVKEYYDSCRENELVMGTVEQSLLLSDEARALSEIEQESRLEEDPRVGEIIDFILKKVPENWDDYSLCARMTYWDNDYWDDRDTDKKPKKRRDRICALEIIKELYGVQKTDRRLSLDVNNILYGLKGLERSKGPIRCGVAYRNQKGFYIDDEFYKEYSDNEQK